MSIEAGEQSGEHLRERRAKTGLTGTVFADDEIIEFMGKDATERENFRESRERER